MHGLRLCTILAALRRRMMREDYNFMSNDGVLPSVSSLWRLYCIAGSL